MKFNKTKRKPCKSINCPHCKETIEFYPYSGMGALTPHFYCDSCSNILYREKDKKAIYENEITEELFDSIIKDLPKCICGGQFSPSANPKCPKCKKEIVHQSTPIQRLSDPHAIQLKGAYLLQPKESS